MLDAGIREVAAGSDDAPERIPLSNYMALLDLTAELTNEPAIALRFGSEVTMPELSLVGLVCQSAPTVKAAVSDLNRYASLALDSGQNRSSQRFSFVGPDDDRWLLLNDPIFGQHRRLAESALARCVSGFSQEFGGRRFAREVHTPHKRPDYGSQYTVFLGAPVVFESDFLGFRLVGDDFLRQKRVGGNPYVFGKMREQANSELSQLEHGRSITGRVREAIENLLSSGKPTLSTVAEALGISRSNLYRRLRRDGTTYSEVLEAVRRRLAAEYLSRKRLTVSETAYLLGYSDASAFSRAYRRWTGKTPGNSEAPELPNRNVN